MERFVETAASCVAAAALAGCAVYVIEQLLPQGRLRECVRLIGSAVIGIIVLACARDAANILTEIKTGENTAVISAGTITRSPVPGSLAARIRCS